MGKPSKKERKVAYFDHINLLGSLLESPVRFFLASGLLFGLLFVIISPPGFGLDERAHFMRTYLVAHGQPLPSTVGQDKHYGAYLPKNLTGLVVTSTTDLLDDGPSLKKIKFGDATPGNYSPYYLESFSAQKVDDRAADIQLLASFAYSPIGYLHMSLVLRLAETLRISVIHILDICRTTNLLLYLALVAVAIKVAKKYKWLIVSVALLPTALFQASSVSLDPLVNAAGFLLFGLMTRYWYDRDGVISQRTNLLTMVAFIIIASTKLPYLPLIFLFLLVPSKRFKSKQNAIIWKMTWVAIPGLIAGSWLIFNSAVTKHLVLLQPGGKTNVTLQLANVLHHPLKFIAVFLNTYYQNIDSMLSSMVGLIGDRQVGLTQGIMYGFLILGVGLAALYYKQSEELPKIIEKKLYPLLTVTIGMVVAIISFTLYLTFTPVGNSTILGLAGRYFLPLLPFIMILVAHVVPIKASPRMAAINTVTISTISFMSLTALLYLLANN